MVVAVPAAVVIVDPAAKLVVPEGASQIVRFASPVPRMRIDDVPAVTKVLAASTSSGRELASGEMMSRYGASSPESTAMPYAAAGQT